jgi:hypothetical protein
MNILKIHLEHLRNEAHYQFLLLVQKLFAEYPEVSSIVAPQLMELNRLVVLEGKLVDAMQTSLYTSDIVKADHRRDRCIVGINAAVASALRHFDPPTVNAARRLEMRLKSFRGEIGKKAYEEESAAVTILLADLRDAYAPQVDALQLSAWVTELEAAQAEFERLFLLRNAERAERPNTKLRDLQRQINTVYRDIVARINAYTLVNGDLPPASFIGEFNLHIHYFSEHSHRHAPKNINLATVASIPNQMWRGEPVIVLPEVYCENRKLVFTVDYELSYRKNNRPGNACIIIHGKGAWKGRKIITFNIIAPAV